MTARSHTRTMHKRKKKIATRWAQWWTRQQQLHQQSTYTADEPRATITDARRYSGMTEQERREFWNDRDG